MTAQTLTNKIALALTGGVTALLTNVAVLGGESDGAPLRWAFEAVQGGIAADVSGRYRGKAEGPVQLAPGAEGQALVFDGASALVAVPAASAFSIGAGPFTVAAWVCPYLVGDGQRIIAAKNDYAANRREWGLMIDKDGLFRFYTHAGGWQTLASKTKPEPGRWRHVAAVFEKGGGRLYVDGQLEGEGPLADTVPATAAPLTFGGVLSGGSSTQLFRGALDEAVLCRAALPADAVARLAAKTPEPHPVPEIAKPVALWSGGALPKSADIPMIPGARFSVVKPHEPEKDGCNWTLGTALVWHKGRLYSSFGFNTGRENTATEEARGRISDDGGRTWGPMFTIDAGEGDLGVSHGVFLSHGGTLWAFHGAFSNSFQRTHTRAYTLDEATGAWRPRGVIVGDGFWPLEPPIRLPDGNWLMSGARVSKGYDGVKGDLPAVAISRGDDFTRWELVVLPCDPSVARTRIWGESAVFLHGSRVVNIARWGSEARALVSFSEDCGRTWTPLRAGNLPMATSKPCAGTLSDGRHYLICTTTADSGGRRAPLTIALTRPGEDTFSRVFVIRHALRPEGPGPSGAGVDLSYPYAVEHDGHLYVGYAIKRHKTAEMAVIPLSALCEPEPAKLWSGGALPKTADAPVLKDVAFHVVKPYEPDRDGYRFLHGVALAWHKGKLYASFGHNRGGENTDTEEARVRISADGGATWGPVTTIDPGDEPGVGVSHGVFLSHGGRLWAFHGAYQGIMQGVHTRACVLNETDGTWERKGTVVEGGFWPLQEPLKMADGNWIMSGIRVGGGDPAAVAVSRGDDFTKWDLAVIPRAAGVKMWGESAVFLDGRRVVNVARCDGRQPVALVAVSEDCGRTWSESRPSDLPMAASKPYAGTLGDGRHYLICSTAADGSNRRSPLTIALSRPGESTLSRLFVIRHALFPDGPGESHPKAGLAYPYAVERDGKLYVGYSNSGGGAGRTGEGRELWNNNSAELAVIPLEALK